MLLHWHIYISRLYNFNSPNKPGNILISALTNTMSASDPTAIKYELSIDMEDWSDNRRFARYRNFRLGDENDKFRLYHGNLYYGNSGDSLHRCELSKMVLMDLLD